MRLAQVILRMRERRSLSTQAVSPLGSFKPVSEYSTCEILDLISYNYKVHECGLYKFRTGYTSRPSTPTASTRGRAAIFNLDAIKSNLFSSSKSSSRGIHSSGTDFGSVSSHSNKRSRSANSRASVIHTQSTGTTDMSFKFSQRSGSTAASSVVDDESFSQKSRESSPRKLFKRGRSPELGIRSGSNSPTKSRDSSRERFTAMYADEDEDEVRTAETIHATVPASDQSEWDLSLRLELARQNSLSQSVAGDVVTERRTERYTHETIVEGSSYFFLITY